MGRADRCDRDPARRRPLGHAWPRRRDDVAGRSGGERVLDRAGARLRRPAGADVRRRRRRDVPRRIPGREVAVARQRLRLPARLRRIQNRRERTAPPALLRDRRRAGPPARLHPRRRRRPERVRLAQPRLRSDPDLDRLAALGRAPRPRGRGEAGREGPQAVADRRRQQRTRMVHPRGGPSGPDRLRRGAGGADRRRCRLRDRLGAGDPRHHRRRLHRLRRERVRAARAAAAVLPRRRPGRAALLPEGGTRGAAGRDRGEDGRRLLGREDRARGHPARDRLDPRGRRRRLARPELEDTTGRAANNFGRWS